MIPQSPEAKQEELEEACPGGAILENEEEDQVELEDELRPGSRGHPRAWLYSLTALLVIFLGAGSQLWSCGLALVLMGVVIWVAPPRYQLRTVPRFMLVWLAVVPLIGLLPAKWFGIVEPWRTRLIQEWSVAVSSSLSPDFKLTVETWLLFVCCLIWLWACLGQNFSDSGRLIAMRLLSAGCMVIAVFFMLEAQRFAYIPWWHEINEGVHSVDFGPFVNRNHSSSLFAFASVLCAGASFDAVRFHSRSKYVFLTGIILLFACIISNTSRAGLLLFLLGMTFWIAIVAMKKGVLRKALVGFAFVAALLSVVLVSNTFLAARLKSRSIAEAIVSDERTSLAGEILSLSFSSSWGGRGLGIFEYVYPQLVTSAAPIARAIHPESDLLWMLFEGGLLILIPCISLIFWFFSTSGPWFPHRKKKSRESRAGRRIRKTFGIATFIALVHAVIDVPLHNLGYFLFVALMASLAIRSRYSGSRITSSNRRVFRFAGLSMVLVGAFLIATFLGIIEPRVPSMAIKLHDRALIEAAKGRRAEAMVLINHAIELAPLDYRFYFLRAQLHYILRQDRDLALLDFGRGRAVEPRYAEFCMDEARFWMKYDPGTAIIAWREGLRRFSRADNYRLVHYSGIVGAYHYLGDFHHSIWQLADNVPMKLTFLNQMVHSTGWSDFLNAFLLDHPNLEDLNDGQVQFLLGAWQRKPGDNGLIDFIKKSPRLINLSWRLIAKDMANQGRFESAFKLAIKFLPKSPRPSSITAADVPRLERSHLLNPVDLLLGVELYFAQRISGDAKAARITLEKVMSLPNAPDFLKRELASLLAEGGDYRGAWDLIRQIIEASPAESSAIGKSEAEDDGIQHPKAPSLRDPNAEL